MGCAGLTNSASSFAFVIFSIKRQIINNTGNFLCVLESIRTSTGIANY